MNETAGLPEPPNRLDAFEAVFQSARLWLLRGIRGRRLLWMLAAILLLGGISYLVGEFADRPHSHVRFLYRGVGTLLLGVVVPACALLLSTAFPWPEAQEGTLTYWQTLPIPRWTTLLGRYLSCWIIGSLLLPLAVLVLYLPLELDPEVRADEFAIAAVAATLLVYPAYLAVFTLLCTALRRGLVIGVVFMLIENSFSFLKGMALQKLSLVFYSRCYVLSSIPDEPSRYQRMGLRNMALDPEMVVAGSYAAIVFVGVILVCTGLAMAVVSTTEYRTKQGGTG